MALVATYWKPTYQEQHLLFEALHPLVPSTALLLLFPWVLCLDQSVRVLCMELRFALSVTCLLAVGTLLQWQCSAGRLQGIMVLHSFLKMHGAACSSEDSIGPQPVLTAEFDRCSVPRTRVRCALLTLVTDVTSYPGSRAPLSSVATCRRI